MYILATRRITQYPADRTEQRPVGQRKNLHIIHKKSTKKIWKKARQRSEQQLVEVDAHGGAQRLEVVAALEDADHRQRAPAQRRRLRRQPREVLLLKVGSRGRA